MTYPIFLCRGVGLPSRDVDGALSEESYIPFGAPSSAAAATDWVCTQVHPVHGSLSVFAVEVIPHHPGGVDGEALCYAVRRLPDGQYATALYTDETAAGMVAAADAAECDTAFEEAGRLTSSALADAHEDDDDDA